jgi:hypothetical protein
MKKSKFSIRGGSGVMRGYIGLPGSGKTTKALIDGLEIAKSGPYYFVVIDSTGTVLRDMEHPANDDTLPYGNTRRRVAVMRADNLEELRANMEKDPSCIHVIFDTEATPTVEYCKALVKETGVCCILQIDEAAFVDECDSATLFKRTLKKNFSVRRHDGIAYLWTTQYPYSVPRMMVSISERIFVGRLEDEIDLRRMREVRLPESDIEKLPTLGVGEFVEKVNNVKIT